MARSEKNLTAVFTDTASAIRAKTGTTETICPLDFADKINAIETGGTGGGMKAFFEAGGKCAYSKAKTFDGIINYSDTENITNFEDMFLQCRSLNKVPNINMNNAKNMRGCFRYNVSITDVDITLNAKDLGYLFDTCSSIHNAKVTSTNETDTILCDSMFGECGGIKTVTLNIPRCSDFRDILNYSSVVSANLGQLFKQTHSDAFSINYKGAFMGCHYLEEVTLDIGSIYAESTYDPMIVYINLQSVFYNCRKQPSRTKPLKVNFLNADVDATRDFRLCFANNDIIESLPAVNCAHAQSLDTAFQNCTSLKELKFYNISDSINISSCTEMTRDALVEVLNNLSDVRSNIEVAPKKCTLGETNLAKLTDEDKAIATNKGWILE